MRQQVVTTPAVAACVDNRIGSRLRDLHLIDLPQSESTCCASSNSPLLSALLPLYWWVHFALALLLLLLLAIAFAWKTKLTTIRLYFFSNDEPFPIVQDTRQSQSCTFAIRLLHPHLLALAHQYLKTDTPFVFLGHIKPLGATETQRMTPQDRHWLNLQCDLGPIARLALAFNLRLPISKRFDDSNACSIEKNISKSLRFSYKLHLPQFVGYIWLVVIAILSAITRPFGEFHDTQYLLILSAFGFLWAYWSIDLHRRETGLLRNWDGLNTHKPFESSPIYVLDYDRDYTPIWFELRNTDFETGIVEYGIDKQNLLNFLLSVLLMLFLVMLQLTK